MVKIAGELGVRKVWAGAGMPPLLQRLFGLFGWYLCVVALVGKVTEDVRNEAGEKANGSIRCCAGVQGARGGSFRRKVCGVTCVY